MKDAKSKLHAAQLNVLVDRLKSGKPLTASQMKFVEEMFPAEIVSHITPDPDIPTPEGDVVSSANELAKRLGIHRQVVAYHRGRTGAPTELSVSAWRDYLILMGKSPTSVKLNKAPSPGTTSGWDCVTAFEVLFGRLSDALPAALGAALNATPSRTVDAVALNLWFCLATVYHQLAREQNVMGPFDPVDGESGHCEYPEEIKKLADRVSAASPNCNTDTPEEAQKTQQIQSDSPIIPPAEAA
jgi:hypothetical protein